MAYDPYSMDGGYDPMAARQRLFPYFQQQQMQRPGVMMGQPMAPMQMEQQQQPMAPVGNFENWKGAKALWLGTPAVAPSGGGGGGHGGGGSAGTPGTKGLLGA